MEVVQVSVQQMSGKVVLLEATADTTVRELKEQLEAWHPSDDELTRKMSTVDLIVGGEKLLENKKSLSRKQNMLEFCFVWDEMMFFLIFLFPEIDPELRTVAESGISADVVVHVLYSVNRIECSSKQTAGCEVADLRVVDIPDTVTSIESCAFEGCTSLVSVTIPDSVSVIKFSAFKNCSSLQSVQMPKSLERIKVGAFRGCCSLKNLSIPASVQEIETSVFSDCRSLKNVNLPEGIPFIPMTCFQNCISLENVAMPDSVVEICPWAFYNCKSLVSLTIPDFVARVGANAFKECGSLSKLIIPKSGVWIAKGAFRGCSNCIQLPKSVRNGKLKGKLRRRKRRQHVWTSPNCLKRLNQQPLNVPSNSLSKSGGENTSDGRADSVWFWSF